MTEKHNRNKKPTWVIEKEQKARDDSCVWLFGFHAVRDALGNPLRRKRRLMLTPNAHHRLADVIGDVPVEIYSPHKFRPPLAPDSVHQGVALEVDILDWGGIGDLAPFQGRDILVLLDRVSDPHNVGAILRSAEVFGARAVIAPARYSAPETGALAKSASGALERQPYIRVRNLADAMQSLRDMGYFLIGLDGTAEIDMGPVLSEHTGPVGLVLGAEGPGLRDGTKAACDVLAKIPYAQAFASLNVSNAAAVALYAAAQRPKSISTK